MSFISDSEAEGRYTREKARLLRVAARKLGTVLEGATITIGEASAAIDKLENELSAKESSRRAYASRARRLLRDYETHKDAAVDTTESNSLFQQDVKDGPWDVSAIRLPGGKQGELRLPANLDSHQLKSAAEQLQMIARLLEMQRESIGEEV